MQQVPTLPQLLQQLEQEGRTLETRALRAILKAFRATDPEAALLLRELAAALLIPDPARRMAQKERLMRIAASTLPDLPPPFLLALQDAVTLGGNVGAGMLAASGAPAALTIAAPAVEAAVAAIPARLTAIWGDARADHAARVGRVMTQALSAGGRYPVRAQLQAALGVSRARAQLIASQETLSALAAGQAAVYDRAEAELDLTIMLTWRSASDRRVRPAHRALSGKTVKRGESFVPGVKLRWPQDSACSDPRQTIRCRCTVLAKAVLDE